MKSKHPQLNVGKPCNEKWDEMSPQQQGAFCKVCTKTVVDFSKMSDREIITFLAKNKQQKTCGRFYKHQLNRPIIAHEPKSNWWKQTSQFLLSILMGLSLPTWLKANPNTKKPKIVIDQNESKKESFEIHVIDENNTTIPNAEVKVIWEGNYLFVGHTDAKGKINIELFPDDIAIQPYIQVSAAGFQLNVNRIHSTKDLTIILQEQELIIDEEIIVMGDVAIEEEIIIKGSVIDDYGEALAFANVVVNNNIGVVTDIDGKYELSIPVSVFKNEEITINYTYIGFEDHEEIINLSECHANTTEKEVVLNANHEQMIMGIMIYVPEIEESSSSDFDSNYTPTTPKWKRLGYPSKQAMRDDKKK